jgi:microcompartment protein CcmL/EutN
VEIIEIRCATGLGGKSFLYLTGDVDSVRAAVEAGIGKLEGTGLILSYVVIPSPTKDITRCIL